PVVTTIILHGISETFASSSGRELDGYTVQCCTRVAPSPRATTGCVVCDECSDYVSTHVDRTEPRTVSGGGGAFGSPFTEGVRESWAGAASAIARSFPWTGRERSIVVLTDTWACLGFLPRSFSG